MRQRHGEVEHDLDAGVGEQRLDGRRGLMVELRGARLGRFGLLVGERDDLEMREMARRLQIGAR